MRKQPSILVLGSLALDYIMKFPHPFSESILKTSITDLNVSFTVQRMRILRGGTGGNISYNLCLLKANTILISIAGKGFYEQGYFHSLQNDFLDLRIDISQDQNTASAFIVSDSNNNQITIFYEGASIKSELIDIESKIKQTDNIEVAINAPNPVNAMIKYTYVLNKLNIPMVFDPGQKINLFTKKQLKTIIPLTSYLIVNSNEFDIMKTILSTNIDYLKTQIDDIIITLGNSGILLYHNKEKFMIPIAHAEKVVDPTGAGDAFRAGFLKGLVDGFSIHAACQLGAVMGSFCVESYGGQSHSCRLKDISARYEKYFGKFPKLKGRS